MSPEAQTGGIGAGENIDSSTLATGDRNRINDYRQVVNVPQTAAERDEWIVAQLIAQNERLVRMDGRLAKLDQIEDALTGNRFYGRLGLVADVHRLWAWIIGLAAAIAVLAIAQGAQWWLLYQIWEGLR